MKDAYTAIMDRLDDLAMQAPSIEFALKDLILSVGFLGVEARRMRRTLDELAADAWEDANSTEIVHVPPRTRRFVPTVVIGGRV
jgi:hypothetical protein